VTVNMVPGSPATVYYYNDAAGSPIAGTDPSGTLLWDGSYYPYGERFRHTDAVRDNYREDLITKNGLWYTGKPVEDSTGLSYFGARWYNPQIGRFYGVDPKPFDEGNPLSFNRYAYGNNNPYRFVDPDGRDASEVIERWWASSVAGFQSDTLGDAAMRSLQAMPGEAAFAAGFGAAIGGIARVVEATGAKLVAGQGGRFATLVGTVGDDLTAHHIPQAALNFTSRADGGAIVMTTAEHEQTRTWFFKGALSAAEDASKTFRDVLAADIRDIRQIVGNRYNTGLRDVIQYYRDNFPTLMNKAE